jgi:hypothetical protein
MIPSRRPHPARSITTGRTAVPDRLIAGTVTARMDDGRWVADCIDAPTCTGALAYPRGSHDLHHCPECGTFARIEWPKRRRERSAKGGRR